MVTRLLTSITGDNHIVDSGALIPAPGRVLTYSGPQAGQAVPHVHAHVLGGRSLTWPPG
jgi:HIT domain